MEIDGSGLVGYVKNGGIVSEEGCVAFLTELRTLMEKYKIDRLDIGWEGPWSFEEVEDDTRRTRRNDG